MFLKLIYNNLFSISSYVKTKKKTLLNSVIYIFLLSLVCNICFAVLGYVKIKPILNEQVNIVYDSIPDFSLTGKGLSVEGEETYEFSFAGVNFYIDDSRSFLDVILERKLEPQEEILFVGQDGYGIVRGTKLMQGNFFEKVSVLKDVELTKDDVNIIYETLNMISKDIAFIVLAIIVLISIVYVYFKGFLNSLFLLVVVNVFGSRMKLKDSYKVSLYANTFYCIYSGIILFSNMNIGVVGKFILTEIITLIYLVLIGLKFIREGEKKHEKSIENKKRP